MVFTTRTHKFNVRKCLWLVRKSTKNATRCCHKVTMVQGRCWFFMIENDVFFDISRIFMCHCWMNKNIWKNQFFYLFLVYFFGLEKLPLLELFTFFYQVEHEKWRRKTSLTTFFFYLIVGASFYSCRCFIIKVNRRKWKEKF